MFHEALYFLASLFVGGLIMSLRFKDGIVVKLGLIVVSMGFLCAAAVVEDHPDLLRSAMTQVAIGAAICALGVLLRFVCSHGQCRRFEDWLDTR